jgi:hypothetical protein
MTATTAGNLAEFNTYAIDDSAPLQLIQPVSDRIPQFPSTRYYGSKQALLEKPTIAAEKVLEYMRDYPNDPIVISGFRAPDEIAYVEEVLKSQGKASERRFIRAGEAIRYERSLERARPGDDQTLSKFRARDLQQQRMGLAAIDELAGTCPLTNETTIEAYLEQIDHLAGHHESRDIDVVAGVANLSHVTDIGLQEAILVALLSVWESHEARQFYTTTEVAGLIGRTFLSIRPKHKDNVSRYFNQDFYAFYEISSTQNGIRTYRLSNTGYGLAVRILRTLLKVTEISM